MAKFKGRLHFSVVLELDLNVDDGFLASEAVKAYENLLLSSEWLAEYAQNDVVTAIKETSYTGSVAIAERSEALEQTGVKLG